MENENDIVARLRDHGEMFPIENASAWIDFASLYLVQAADEIERLRAALKDHIDAAERIRHWHDAMEYGSGMVVSAEHVRLLWDATHRAREPAKIAWPHRVLHEAVDEIERLRSALCDAQNAAVEASEVAGEACIRASAAEAEIERLREALEELIVAVDFEAPPIVTGNDVRYRARVLMRCANQARAALKKET